MATPPKATPVNQLPSVNMVTERVNQGNSPPNYQPDFQKGPQMQHSQNLNQQPPFNTQLNQPQHPQNPGNFGNQQTQHYQESEPQMMQGDPRRMPMIPQTHSQPQTQENYQGFSDSQGQVMQPEYPGPGQLGGQVFPEYGGVPIVMKPGWWEFLKHNSKTLFMVFVLLLIVQLSGVSSLFRKLAGMLRFPESFLYSGAKFLAALFGTITFLIFKKFN